MIYLDYAATSWPKPPEVLGAMTEFLERAGGNPGRSGHSLSVAAARIIYQAREAAAELFQVNDPLRVIFAPSATYALNLALRGLLKPDGHVVTSGLEHNSVMRPLRALERAGARLSVAPCGPDGAIVPGEIAAALTPRTRLVVLTHASNVTGALTPIGEIAPLVRRHGALLLVDAAQTAGVVPIDVEALGADLLAFSGHKGLHGPPGTGGLVLGSRVDPDRIEPLARGGTGSRSESEEQPDDLPDKFESGTPNGPGLAGLGAGIRWVLRHGVDALRKHELEMVALLEEGLARMPGVKLYGPRDPARRVAITSFTAAGRQVSDVCRQLDDEFGILCRVGLHCAPAAHRTLGTFPDGTIRLAPGPSTTPEDIRATLSALEAILRP